MRLKSLEIKGFKSFADKTIILLDNPITGIVGPNGCGKSNIVDAIRWVIGEHKIKSLRSDNLEDLIFNGSRTRPASGLAEVAITFENTRNLLPTEFTTVTITRKFYKNGESEYRLNDVSCRLKDILNLFLDTGISNDSYAIIELGMVDEIIKDKDGARRRMLEQAAGISIYKARKKEARQKLELTEGDISRIDDLLFEIGNNLRTLEAQAKKAEKYLVIKGEYKEVSIELAKASLEKFNEQFKTLNGQHDIQVNLKAELDALVATGEAAIEQHKLVLIEKEQALNIMQKQYNELVNTLRKIETEKKLAIQSIEHQKEREKSLNDFLAGAVGQAKNYEESIGLSEKLINDESLVLESFKKELEQLKLAVEEKRKAFDEKKRAVEVLRNEYQLKQRLQFENEKKTAIAETSLTNYRRSLKQVQDEITLRITQIATIDKEKAENETKLGLKQADLQNALEHQQSVKAKILNGQEQLEVYRQKLTEENRKLDAKKNEHDLLKSLVESLEGFPDSIKFLKKHKEWNNQTPLLSDIFIVKNEYRVAIENVLDTYLNFFVVNNLLEGLKAISLLEGNKKGKANFFLLDKLKPMMPSEGMEGITPALSVLTVEDAYKMLAVTLLGHVFIVENANLLAEDKIVEGNIYVDIKGNLIRTRHSIGGGSTGVFEGNKLGRAKNLERLSAEILVLNDIVHELKKQIADLQKQLAGFNAELNDKNIELLRQEINKLQNQSINLSHRKENFNGLNHSAQKRISEIQSQINDAQQGMVGVKNDAELLNHTINTLQERIEKAENDFRTVDLGYNEISQNYNKQNISYTRQHSKIDTLKQELRFRTNQLNELRKQVATNNENLVAVTLKLEETTEKLKVYEDDIYNLLSKKEVEEKNLNEQDRLYHTFRNEIAFTESNLSQKRREKDHAENILLSIKDKINTMKLQVAGISERLSIEFKVTLDSILDEERKTEKNIEELTLENEKFKKRLENMGEVNPTAIEAYAEIKLRYDFINVQKDDLTQAKISLLKTIEEVENTANSKFNETFRAVRENFIQVFKALFTAEDNCDLRLTDTEITAESNIEIYAQPKGKKPSTLTQLSGGEKTLTSTAFLFAIYLIKPAPFCILDEVDAPLDDANVLKFTQMIRKFSVNSQFIIVTHNKQTMAAVDVIYGVTMQEAGVSKLVPVDFRSLN